MRDAFPFSAALNAMISIIKLFIFVTIAQIK